MIKSISLDSITIWTLFLRLLLMRLVTLNTTIYLQYYNRIHYYYRHSPIIES